ncbi:MAG: hypothetical protein ACRCWB_11545 [Enterovibrio sp.]
MELIISAKPLGLAEIDDFIAKNGGNEIVLTSYAPFVLSLPEVGAACEPYGEVRFVIEDKSAKAVIGNLQQIAWLNQSDLFCKIAAVAAVIPVKASRLKASKEQAKEKENNNDVFAI